MLAQTPSNDKLMKVFDILNNRYGTDTLFIGSQVINQKWGMRREMLPPRYTIKWLDVPVAALKWCYTKQSVVRM